MPPPEELNALLVARDEAILAGIEFSDPSVPTIAENEQIRELRRIVLETSEEETTYYSCT